MAEEALLCFKDVLAYLPWRQGNQTPVLLLRLLQAVVSHICASLSWHVEDINPVKARLTGQDASDVLRARLGIIQMASVDACG